MIGTKKNRKQNGIYHLRLLVRLKSAQKSITFVDCCVSLCSWLQSFIQCSFFFCLHYLCVSHKNMYVTIGYGFRVSSLAWTLEKVLEKQHDIVKTWINFIFNLFLILPGLTKTPTTLWNELHTPNDCRSNNWQILIANIANDKPFQKVATTTTTTFERNESEVKIEITRDQQSWWIDFIFASICCLKIPDSAGFAISIFIQITRMIWNFNRFFFL